MRNRTTFLVVALLSTLVAGCGGGSGSGSGFTNNLTATWIGSINLNGLSVPIAASISQPVSGSVRNVTRSFNGTLIDSNNTFVLNGQKDGDTVSFSITTGAAPGFVGTFVGGLDSEVDMSGLYSDTSGQSGPWFLGR